MPKFDRTLVPFWIALINGKTTQTTHKFFNPNILCQTHLKETASLYNPGAQQLYRIQALRVLS